MAEMLLQSHAGEIHILPALPDAWPAGHVKGLCARGGFVVEIEWENRALSRVKILSKAGSDCKVRYKNKVTDMKTEKGRVYVLDENLE
jgi:alpha-L-fucosidase 2